MGLVRGRRVTMERAAPLPRINHRYRVDRGNRGLPA